MKNLKDCFVNESSKQKANIFIPLCGSLQGILKETDDAIEHFKKIYKLNIYGFNDEDVMDYESVYKMQKDATGPHPSLDEVYKVIKKHFGGDLNIIYYI